MQSKEQNKQTKEEVLQELRTMFRTATEACAAGGSNSRLSHVRGCVDGYMRALLDLGIATRTELLALVATERERLHGPAVGTVESSPSDVVAA